MIFYCPAFVLALPDGIFNLQQEFEKENRANQQHEQARRRGMDEQPTPRTSSHGPADSTELSPLLQRGNESIQADKRYDSCLDSNSGSTVEGIQQTTVQ